MFPEEEKNRETLSIDPVFKIKPKILPPQNAIFLPLVGYQGSNQAKPGGVGTGG
jgi:hypothetical protein